MTHAGRILVVDDNLTNRTVLTRSLGKAGYETEEAADGERALALAAEWRPDLVLLDVSMPGRDGFEVCRRLKADEDTMDVPVIFVTSLEGRAEVERAFEVGGSDYVTKPFHLGEVKARVSVHLRLRSAELDLQRAHADLLQAQKLESVGLLAAGIAHEINTPTQYVGDNTRFLLEASEALLPLLDRARALAEAVAAGGDARDRGAELTRAWEEAEVDYLREEMPKALAAALGGLERVGRIVGAMKDFSHPRSEEKDRVDVHRGIESTITMTCSEWKHVADLETDFDRDLPPVPCFPGELNQVVLNLIVNAAHAIGDAVKNGGGKGRITVSTRRAGDAVEIRVADTGTGIPVEAREHVFDPFFTTKDVGQGTGQGLAIARDVVVGKHGGALSFETELGRGTTFVVRLPLAAEDAER